jgi:guanylate kinase
MHKQGKLIIFSAPSGAGKTTLVRELFLRIPGLGFSVSATTRPPRNGEVHGHDYHFMTPDEFKQHIQKDDFVEFEEVYPEVFYGTLKQEVDQKLDQGFHVVFDIDVKGGLNIKNLYKDQALALFIMPPDESVLEERLRNRGTESLEIVTQRLQKARWELSFSHQFDAIVINDHLESAIDEVVQRVNAFIAP